MVGKFNGVGQPRVPVHDTEGNEITSLYLINYPPFGMSHESHC